LPQAEIVFLYLGQLDQSLADASIFAPARESVGPVANPLAPRSHLLEVSGSVYGGQLRMVWRYSENLHRRSTVERLAEGFASALCTLIALSRSAETVAYMPADFADAGLSQEELDDLIAELTASEGQNLR
ncbi:MAG: hypothetical protein LC802_10380, partial [Acidobacteria bacterium]|nr:hypothetical protein [Acidobacteriota bacterium]